MGSSAHTFSSFTRKPLYSGQKEFGSRTGGVVILARLPPCFPRPMNPQWIGKPICYTFLPAMVMGLIRLVSMALPSMCPRAELTRTISPSLIPIS